MSAKYWIKLYHEILHDPKMARMDDRIWRRAIELFLIAGEQDNSGSLPSLDDIAWILRTNPEQLETEMIELQRVGIVSVVQSNYMVTKFAERQEPMPKAEYMQRKRNERQRKEYYQPVTECYQSVTNSNADKIRIDKNRIESEADADANNNIPNYSPSARAELIFCNITGFTSFISKSKDKDIATILALLRVHGDQTETYCQPFYNEWVNRKYNKTNTAWLEWAVTGEIPEPKQNGSGPKTNVQQNIENIKLGVQRMKARET